jgi:Spy/CpxP family protein refolding chaperone
MNSVAKNKLLLWLVALLLVANAASIAMFWLGKNKQLPTPKGPPNEFLIRELKLDGAQQAKLDILVKEHRAAAEELRGKIKESKEAFFDLLKQTAVTDSMKQVSARAVSVNTEALDLLTLEHFQKIRALCTPEQQKKFDDILHEVTSMMGQPRPPMGRHNEPGDPPLGPPPPAN